VPRFRSVYDAQGKKLEYTDGVLTWSRPGVEEERGKQRTHFIQPDIPEFVSPIDGRSVRGRVQYRKHCRDHDVVPTMDLKGLPMKPLHNFDRKPDPELKRTIIEAVNRYEIRP